MAEQVIIRFDAVTFEYEEKKPVLDEVCFGVRKGAKLTLMGQNGAGKSTIFKLIKGELKPTSGIVSITNGATIGTAAQMVAKTDLELTLEAYFAKAFEIVPADIKSRTHKALNAVDLSVPIEWKVSALSGGQQARLLLAFALIQNPDILLLDEPTNHSNAIMNLTYGRCEKRLFVCKTPVGFPKGVFLLQIGYRAKTFCLSIAIPFRCSS